MFPFDIESDKSNDEMDTRGSHASVEFGVGPSSTPFELGLSKASLKKYSSPARRRILARQQRQAELRALAARQIAEGNNEVLGFGLPKIKLPKVNLHKLNKLAQKVGPLAAVAFPAAAPAIGSAMKVLNAADKRDPKALAALAATTALAESGNPDAQAAVELYKTARKVKSNVQATNLLQQAASGDKNAQIKIEVIKRTRDIDPAAEDAFQALNSANEGHDQVQALKAEKLTPAPMPLPSSPGMPNAPGAPVSPAVKPSPSKGLNFKAMAQAAMKAKAKSKDCECK